MGVMSRIPLLVAAAVLTLAACSSGIDPSMSAAFCEASTKWGESLSILGAQESALFGVAEDVTDPADPDAVAKMHQIAADLLAQANTAQDYADAMIANTKDQDVIDAILEVNTATIDIAITMGEDARDADTLTAFAESIVANNQVFQELAEFDVVTTMTVISDYGRPICNPS
jgi:hypothetical protein